MYDINDLKRVMERLRDPQYGCPWDLAQTYQSIAPFTLEECLELVDALEQADVEHVEEELGDLLFQVVFYAQLGREDGQFDFDSVVAGITEKLIRRHPHVFHQGKLEGVIRDKTTLEDIKRNWESAKATERLARAQHSVMDDVPSTLSALARAQKLQKRASGVGFDFDTLKAISLKLTEELDELSCAIELGVTQEIESELGDVLFTVVNMARHLKVDSEAALRKSNRRFEARVRTAEGDALADGSRLGEENIQRLDARWQEAKRKERSR
jgi:ATP diphosphatase